MERELSEIQIKIRMLAIAKRGGIAELLSLRKSKNDKAELISSGHEVKRRARNGLRSKSSVLENLGDEECLVTLDILSILLDEISKN
ncbi:hypothetical protein MAR_013398 [Mya arenaria]|uniref:Uncharacterized protein n=1 Tax=Mya arenaria TaxID=6604 RepID=A0ABY7G351_MYAAR|nr:hypothetical protein MAR_013398 [Mya arenaria]